MLPKHFPRFSCLILLLLSFQASAIDLSQAKVVVLGEGAALGTAATVLVEEIDRRTGLQWERVQEAPASGPSVTLAIDADAAPGPEGYIIETSGTGQISITGEDARGILFGVGHLIRSIDWDEGEVTLAEPLKVSTKPEYAIRGHQLGYRARANSWDAWTREQFDQFIRELAFFGTNAIENIPFQDHDVSPHFKMSRREMNRVMSEICAKYDLEYWVWVPAEFELTIKEEREKLLQQHAQLYKDVPRLNGVFFPGADPGDNHPNDVMPFLEDLSKLLAETHPEGKVWVSAQGFRGEKLNAMFAWIDQHNPAWLGGVIGGPQAPPLEVLRERLNPRYQVRDYPDITHIVRCQYEVPNLDQAFALTLGRECIMARPKFYTEVFRRTAPHTNGFISYTDGVHDDPNKILWSALGWDSKREPRELMVEYSRVFFGSKPAERAADGILMLEEDWDGPIEKNPQIEKTLAHWQALEKEFPELKDNWRWQMLLTRASYDAYTKERQARERELEKEAMALLQKQAGKSPEEAMQAALDVLQRPDKDPVRPDLRDRVIALYADLFESIQLQSDTEHYQASGPERGASLEFLDYPLNDRFWLEDEFKKVSAMANQEEKWARLDTLRTWENPGQGSFYDNLGHLSEMPHVVWPEGVEPRSGGFVWWDEGHSRAKLAWQVNLWPRGGMRYEELDSHAQYLLRFTGFGDMTAEADGQTLEASAYGKEHGEFKDYPVPQELVKDGVLEVTLRPQFREGVNWRQQPRLSEAWLIKQ